MDRTGQVVGQKMSLDMDENGHRVGLNCPTTINNTITENYRRTIASPTPLSTFGRTSAALVAGLCPCLAPKFIWWFTPFFVDHQPEMLYHIVTLLMTNNSVARPVFCVGIYSCFA
jgi:hypothetical protein